MNDPVETHLMLKVFLEGAVWATGLAIALFFIRFWNRTHDRLFLLFAIAFGLLACNRLALTLIPLADETRTHLYWVRLIAYVLIIVAIIDKNRAVTKSAA